MAQIEFVGHGRFVARTALIVVLALSIYCSGTQSLAQQNPFTFKNGAIAIDPKKLFKKRSEQPNDSGSEPGGKGPILVSGTAAWSIRSDGAINLSFEGQDSTLDLDGAQKVENFDPLLHLAILRCNSGLSLAANPLSYLALFEYARSSDEAGRTALLKRTKQFSECRDEFERNRFLNNSDAKAKVESLANPAREATGFFQGQMNYNFLEYDFKRGGYRVLDEVYAMMDAAEAEGLKKDRDSRRQRADSLAAAAPLTPTYQFGRGVVGQGDPQTEKNIRRAVGYDACFYIQYDGKMAPGRRISSPYLAECDIRVFLVKFDPSGASINEWKELKVIDEREVKRRTQSPSGGEITTGATGAGLGEKKGSNSAVAGPAFSIRGDGSLNLNFESDKLELLSLAIERSNPGLSPLYNPDALRPVFELARFGRGSIEDIVKSTREYRNGANEFERRRIANNPELRGRFERLIQTCKQPQTYFFGRIVQTLPPYDFDRGGYPLNLLASEAPENRFVLLSDVEAEELARQKPQELGKINQKYIAQLVAWKKKYFAFYLQVEGALPQQTGDDWPVDWNTATIRVFLANFEESPEGKATLVNLKELKLLTVPEKK